MARPRATSERTNSGVMKSGTDAPSFAVVVGFLRHLQHFLAAEIFALGDVDHFFGDHARAGPFQLGDGVMAFILPCRGRVGAKRRVGCCESPKTPAGKLRWPTSPLQGEVKIRSAERLRRVGEIAREVLAGRIAVIDRLDRAAVIGLDAAAFLDPFDAGARQTLFQVERGVGVGVGAGRIVDRNRRLAGGGIERNLAQRHFQVGRSVRPRVNLARAHDRPGGDLRRGEIGFGDMFVHRCTPEFPVRAWPRPRARVLLLPVIRSRSGSL